MPLNCPQAAPWRSLSASRIPIQIFPAFLAVRRPRRRHRRRPRHLGSFWLLPQIPAETDSSRLAVYIAFCFVYVTLSSLLLPWSRDYVVALPPAC